ncbi:unnamed protein product, partial [Prorocentrum cordatum]
DTKLDVATRDAVTYNVVHFGTSIECARSDDQSRQRVPSGQDALAAQSREDDDRQKYSEASGRPGNTAVDYARSLADGLERTAFAKVLLHAWQQLRCLLQVGNDEALSAAIGT